MTSWNSIMWHSTDFLRHVVGEVKRQDHFRVCVPTMPEYTCGRFLVVDLRQP